MKYVTQTQKNLVYILNLSLGLYLKSNGIDINVNPSDKKVNTLKKCVGTDTSPSPKTSNSFTVLLSSSSAGLWNNTKMKFARQTERRTD